MHSDEHMTVTQVATFLGESRWTVQRRIRSGQLPAIRYGGGTNPYIIRRSDVEALLDEARS